MSNEIKVNGGGVSFLGLLFIVFLVLKLTNVINWSWWWVTAPLWGGFAFAFAVIILTLLIQIIADIIKQKKLKT